MQFKVPQDVQREDTIVGPLTMKQLLIVAMGGGMAYASYVTLAQNYYWQVWAPPTAIIGILTLSFAFLKIHNLTFFKFVLALIEFLFLPRRRIWIKGAAEVTKTMGEQTKTQKKPEAPKKEKSLKNLDQLIKILDSRGVVKKPEVQ